MNTRKHPKILIIGLGSIGQRHHRNLLALGYGNVWAYDANNKKIKDLRLKISTLTPSALQDFDVAFICTPNYLHMKHALLAARAGCDLFIEKPLSHSLKGIDRKSTRLNSSHSS